MTATIVAHRVHAVLIGHHLNLRPLQRTGGVLASVPLTVEVAGGGMAVLFRFGVVVFFDVAPAEQATFLQQIAEYVADPLSDGETEALTVLKQPDAVEGPTEEGVTVNDDDLPTLQLIADILAKSLVLENYELSVGRSFDLVEPLARRLREGRHGVRRVRDLISHIGDVLQIQHRLVGRAEVGEKPDLLWDHPERERLYARLDQEYEIRERRLALERKLGLINETAETLLELIQAQRSLRVEWYIVILIVVEIVLTLYELFLH